MVKPRVPETDHGITGEFNTQAYDVWMRNLRDRGWIETRDIIREGITHGRALEVGPGPGYLGLEWLKNTTDTTLKGLDISEDMIALARQHAEEYGFTERAEYFSRDARMMPFEDNHFDAAFSNGSLHEWAHPEDILNEIARVLKPGGRYIISDLRRDMIFPMKWFLWFMTRPKEMRWGLTTSLKAAYILPEVESIVARTNLQGWRIRKNILGIVISGQKPER
jgi:ubiquinone/menaquinone biosynthesis C-methylase UbiE